MNYIDKIKDTFGVWDDFEELIAAQPISVVERDFMDILFALPEESVANYFTWIKSQGKVKILIDTADDIFQCISKFKTRDKTSIENTLDILVELKNPIIDHSFSTCFMSILNGPYSQGNLWMVFSICNKYKDVGNLRKIIDDNYKNILAIAFSDNNYINEKVEILDVIYQLILEVTKKEKIRLSDVSFLGDGKDSNCLQVGNYVFKFGNGRILDVIPKHKRIINSLLRRNVPIDYVNMIDSGEINKSDVLAIEIQPLTDNRWYEELSDDEIEEKLYGIYKELREDGIEWTDIKKENVGKEKYTIDGDGLVIFDTERLFLVDKTPKFEEWQLKGSLCEKFRERYSIETSVSLKR